MKLNWPVNQNATVMHVAAALAGGSPLSDPRLTRALQTPAAAMRDEILRANVAAEEAWLALTTHACQHADVGATVRAALPLFGQENAHALQERLIQLATELAEGIRQMLPGLEEDLRHRSRPLREQWDARGPGFLHSLRQWTGPHLSLDEASVFAVHPVLGGGGDVDPLHAAVRIEALLANTVPGLPEVVRLGWLLGQLACHRAIYPQGPKLPNSTLIELAMVPPTLAAAETVELAACNAETVSAAIVAWQRFPLGEQTPAIQKQALHVWDWWQARQPLVPWDAAVDALANRLQAAGCPAAT